jgi:DNA-binding MarR family transcriptional regulator
MDAIERVFHEPNRMAILSVLCASRAGVPFTELRDRCGLTDGNLNRHIKTLEEAGVVRCKKAFVNDKPRTTVFLTSAGTKRFQAYLDALTEVLKQAKSAIRRESASKDMPAARLATT